MNHRTSRTVFILIFASILASGCGMQSKPAPEDVTGVMAKRFQKLGIRYQDLSVSDLNCANDGAKWRCTFTSSARDLNYSKTEAAGKEIYHDQLTVSPSVQLILIKGDQGWMETR